MRGFYNWIIESALPVRVLISIPSSTTPKRLQAVPRRGKQSQRRVNHVALFADCFGHALLAVMRLESRVITLRPLC